MRKIILLGCVFVAVIFFWSGHTEKKNVGTIEPQKVETRSQKNEYAPTQVSMTPEPAFTEEEISKTVVGSVMAKVNVNSGRIWDQYCELIREGGVIVKVECDESWAMKPLPGGCSGSAMDFLGSSSCTAAALAYVINIMLTPDEIQAVLGEENFTVTPDLLIEKVYLDLPKSVSLTCLGASVPTIRDTLTYFGLKSRSVPLSKYSLRRKIRDGEMAIVGVSANYRGELIDHWTVLSNFDGEKIYFADSYIGRGSVVNFDDIEDVTDWEITSVLFVSRPLP